MTFNYPIEDRLEGDFLYVGGVDFNSEVCTWVGLNEDGLAAIPTRWDITDWGAVSFGVDSIAFENIEFIIPFSADTCEAQVNIGYRFNADDSPFIYPELAAFETAPLTYEYRYSFDSAALDITAGCSDIELNGVLFLP